MFNYLSFVNRIYDVKFTLGPRIQQNKMAALALFSGRQRQFFQTCRTNPQCPSPLCLVEGFQHKLARHFLWTLFCRNMLPISRLVYSSPSSLNFLVERFHRSLSRSSKRLYFTPDRY